MDITACLRTKRHYGSVKLSEIWCVAKDREMCVVSKIHANLDLSHRAMTSCPRPTSLDIKDNGLFLFPDLALSVSVSLPAFK